MPIITVNMKLPLICLLISAAYAADIIDEKDCESFPCKIFEDNFDYLDHHIWEHEITMSGGGNSEFEVYVNNRSVSYVNDGILYIKPQLVNDWRGEDFVETETLDLWGQNGPNQDCTANAWNGCRKEVGTDIINPVMSGRLRTLGKFSFKYGKIETRARMPSGDWLWPAIWLLPERYPYGEWPASGEIDIVEMRGNEEYGDISNYMAGSTVHWGPYFEANRFPWTRLDYATPDGSRFPDDFHTWTLEWNSEGFKYYLDDSETPYYEVDPITNFWDYGNFSEFGDPHNPWEGREKMAPFDQEFYFILCLAVGGTGGYFPDDVPSNPAKPWTNDSPKAMREFWEGRNLWLPTWKHGEERISEKAALQIDYLRVWKTGENDVTDRK